MRCCRGETGGLCWALIRVTGPADAEQRVTSNVEALLAENDALRREVLRLSRELERLQRQQRQRLRTIQIPSLLERAIAQSPPRISRQQCRHGGRPSPAAGLERHASTRFGGVD